MASLLIFFIIISSGSVLSSAIYNKSYEDALPITVGFIILTLFLFGIFNLLSLGFIFILLLSLGCYCFSIYYVFHKKTIKQFANNLITPGFIIFSLFYCVLIVCNKGRVPSFYDEFTHWADIVKVMTQLNTFGTNAVSDSLFASYPPGTALFLYFNQKLHLMFDSGAAFSQWRMYLAHQTIFVSFLLPFLKGFHFKQFLFAIISASVLLISPLIFFGGYLYTGLLVDSLLGIIGGAALGMIFVTKDKDIFYKLYIFFSTAILVLIKDAGIIFGAFIVFAYCIDELVSDDNKLKLNRPSKANLSNMVYSVSFLIVPKLLWSIHVNLSGCKVAFSNPVELKSLIKVLLFMDDSYRSTVFKYFWSLFINNGVSLFTSGIKISYLSLTLLMLAFTYYIYTLYKNDSGIKLRTKKPILVISFVQLAMYIIGLCTVTYMFKFSVGEALGLASYDRYIKIGFLASWMLLMVMIIRLMLYWKDGTKRVCAIMLCILAMSPWINFAEFVSRETVYKSQETMKSNIEFAEYMRRYIPADNSRIYFVGQETLGYEYISTRYLMRPNMYNDNFSWSIGEPFSEEDYATKTITADEWHRELMEKYDYVALYKINDYFIENFGDLFMDRDDIKEKGIYSVDKSSGKLILCNEEI